MDMKGFNEQLEKYNVYQAQKPSFENQIKGAIELIDYEDPNLAFAKFLFILVCEIEYHLKQ